MRIEFGWLKRIINCPTSHRSDKLVFYTKYIIRDSVENGNDVTDLAEFGIMCIEYGTLVLGHPSKY